MDKKLIKDIAKRHGISQLFRFMTVGKDLVEAETRNTGKRVRVNVKTEQVYEFDNLLRHFEEVS